MDGNSEACRRWAERLAMALRDDDGDTFISAYDDLLDDPAAYSDEQVEAIKEAARHMYDSRGLMEVGESTLTALGSGAPPLPAAEPSSSARSEPPAPTLATKHARHSEPAASGRPSSLGTGERAARDVAVQTSAGLEWCQYDEVETMLRQRWLDALEYHNGRAAL